MAQKQPSENLDDPDNARIDQLLVVAEHLDPRQDLAAFPALRLIESLPASGVSVQVVCGVCPQWAEPKTVDMEAGRVTRLAGLGLINWLKRSREAVEQARAQGRAVLSLSPMVRGDLTLLINDTERQRIAIHADPIGRGGGGVFRRGLAKLRPENMLRLWTERRALSIPRHRTKQPQPMPHVHANPAVFEYGDTSALRSFGYHDDKDVAQVPVSLPDWPYDSEQLGQWRETIRRGVDISEQTPVVLFPASRPRVHGFGPVMLALQRLKSEGHPLVVLLAGRYRYTHLSWIAELGIRDRVRFMGPTQHLDALYAAADAVAHPTCHDPHGEAVLRAIAAGKPIVTTEACKAIAETSETRARFLPVNPSTQMLVDAIDAALAGSETEPIEPSQSPRRIASTPMDQARQVIDLLVKAGENPQTPSL